MKLAVLTTQTLHHTYFIREVTRVFPVTMAIVEWKVYQAPFDTHHLFEDRREMYEREVFFGGKDVSISDIVPVKKVESINDLESLWCLNKLKPDLIIVFGTGMVSKDITGLYSERIVNLHGGNPQEYRGLDSHLWAIYHRDFNNLVTTLHRVNKKLDDGEIVSQIPIIPALGMGLHELRRYNTEICVRLVTSALDVYRRQNRFISRPQQKKGRYYSFMPAVLKEICLVNFRKYMERIS
ncbi:MAG: hypothetical protein ISS45_00070 [Candidatus Omnitrophica bacterium]|nr:hypothetical protein [Candidatus Omnitrophota bacterium]